MTTPTTRLAAGSSFSHSAIPENLIDLTRESVEFLYGPLSDLLFRAGLAQNHVEDVLSFVREKLRESTTARAHHPQLSKSPLAFGDSGHKPPPLPQLPPPARATVMQKGASGSCENAPVVAQSAVAVVANTSTDTVATTEATDTAKACLPHIPNTPPPAVPATQDSNTTVLTTTANITTTAEVSTTGTDAAKTPTHTRNNSAVRRALPPLPPTATPPVAVATQTPVAPGCGGENTAAVAEAASAPSEMQRLQAELPWFTKVNTIHDALVRSEFVYVCAIEDVLIKKYIVRLRHEAQQQEQQQQDFTGAALNSIASFLSFRSAISTQDIATIFSNIEVLIDVNRKLLDGLLMINRDKDLLANIASQWNQITPFLKMYSVYINNFKRAIETVQRLRQTSPTFQEMVQQIEMEARANARTRDSAELLFLLSLPINRIPKYSHYLEQVLSAVPETDLQYRDIKRAFELMTAVDHHVNQALRMSEGQDALLAIARKLYGFESLVEAHRRFIREGACKWSGQTASNKFPIQNGHVFLFTDLLLACIPHAAGDGFDVALVLGLLCATPSLKADNSVSVISDTGDEVVMSFSTEKEQILWHETVSTAITALGKGTRVFGVALSLILSRPKETDAVPQLVRDIVEHLQANHMDEEGIFRRSGGADEIQRMVELVDSGVRLSFGGVDPHSITGLLKRFLRSMRVPLLRPIYRPLLDSIGLAEPQRTEQIRGLLLSLPVESVALLAYLMRFLLELSTHQASTLMGVSNLALVIAPNILSPENPSPGDAMEVNVVNKVVALLIEKHSELFSC